MRPQQEAHHHLQVRQSGEPVCFSVQSDSSCDALCSDGGCDSGGFDTKAAAGAKAAEEATPVEDVREAALANAVAGAQAIEDDVRLAILEVQSRGLPLDALETFRASLDATQRKLADGAVQLYILALPRAADDRCGVFHDAFEACRASLGWGWGLGFGWVAWALAWLDSGLDSGWLWA